MYPSEELARNRHSDALSHAEQARVGRQLAELRRLERLQQRAEHRLVTAWRRADEVRTLLQSAS